MMVMVPPPREKPLYNTLGDLKLILDATGLRDNTNNAYGQVTGGTAQIWKSIPPAPTGTIVSLAATPGGNPGESSIMKFFDGYIEFPGYTFFTYDSVAGVNFFDFLQFASPVTNLKSTIHMVLKAHSEENPNVSIGFYGDNAGTQGAKGDCTFYDDRVGFAGQILNRNHAATSYMTKGAIPYIVSASNQNSIVPNVPFVFTQETDMSAADINKRRFYINGIATSPSGLLSSLAVVSGPTYPLQIGAAGNKQSPFRGWISHVIMQARIETGAVRDAFIQSLLPYKNKASSNYYYQIDESAPGASVYDTLAATGRYYYSIALISPPNNKNKVLQFYSDSDSAVVTTGKIIAMRTSNDRGKYFGAQTTVRSEAAPWGGQIGAFGYDNAGRVHGMTDWHSVIGPTGGLHKIIYSYSDNDGVSWTHDDISSVFAGDGLITYRIVSRMFEHAGFMWVGVWKYAEEAAFTSSIPYLLRKPIGASTTWTKFALHALGPLNYPNVVPLGEDSLLVILPNVTTKLWHQKRITNLSSGTPTIIDDGAISFAESRTVSMPIALSWFQMNGQRVIQAIIPDVESATKNNKVVYGVASNIETNGTLGWNLLTKVTIYSGLQSIYFNNTLHYNNDFNGIMSSQREENPPVQTNNNLVCTHLSGNIYYETRRKLFGITSGP